jgi:hypothetical protein
MPALIPRLTAAALALLLAVGFAAADPGMRWHEGGRDRDKPRHHPQRSVNDVIGEVENRYGGKVVGVQQTQRDEQMMYRVRVLQRDGRVKTLMVPADGRR